MIGRRLLLLVALLLAVGAIAAALTPRDLRRGADTTPTATTATTPRSTVPTEATGGTGAGATEVTRTVNADAPEAPVVRAQVGNLLHLTVNVPSPDVVELDGLGRFDPADPSTPARFDFFLDSAGVFPIRLQESGREVGRLSIAAG